MKKLIIFFLVVFFAIEAFTQPKLGISGTLEWDTMLIKTTVSLDLASAGIRLPAGRTQAETLLNTGYLSLIQPAILEMQADSSSTVGDLILRGELSLPEVEAMAKHAISVPPALSPDLAKMTSSHTLSISNLSTALMRHSRPSQTIRTLNPVSAARYTGIVIIATDSLPVHGMRGTALPIPCLFPKIWDSEMNLIYERSMLESRNSPMVRYSALQDIFRNNPSGLSPELQEVVGDRPLRIFARGVFGINPTDLIIDRNDAMLIISSEENRCLLSQGKVAIILDESVLKKEFNIN